MRRALILTKDMRRYLRLKSIGEAKEIRTPISGMEAQGTAFIPPPQNCLYFFFRFRPYSLLFGLRDRYCPDSEWSRTTHATSTPLSEIIIQLLQILRADITEPVIPGIFQSILYHIVPAHHMHNLKSHARPFRAQDKITNLEHGSPRLPYSPDTCPRKRKDADTRHGLSPYAHVQG